MLAMKRFTPGGTGSMFGAEIRKRHIHHRSFPIWRWHLDGVFVRVNGETDYLRWAMDHEGEVLEAFFTKRRDRKAAVKFLRKAMKRYGRPNVVVRDKLRSTIILITNVTSTAASASKLPSSRACGVVCTCRERRRPVRLVGIGYFLLTTPVYIFPGSFALWALEPGVKIA